MPSSIPYQFRLTIPTLGCTFPVCLTEGNDGEDLRRVVSHSKARVGPCCDMCIELCYFIAKSVLILGTLTEYETPVMSEGYTAASFARE